MTMCLAQRLLKEPCTAILMACFFCGSLSGQGTAKSAFLYSIEQGISDRIVRDVRKDSFGYVWVCEQRALQLWDGQTFTHLYELFPQLPSDCPCNRLWLDESELLFQEFYNQHSYQKINLQSGQVWTYDIDSEFIVQADQNDPLWLKSDSTGFSLMYLSDSLHVVRFQHLSFSENVIATTLVEGQFFVLDDRYNYAIVDTSGAVRSKGQISDTQGLGRPKQLIADSKQRIRLLVDKDARLFQVYPDDNRLVELDELESPFPLNNMFLDKKDQLFITSSNRDLYNKKAYLLSPEGGITERDETIRAEENFNTVYSEDFSQYLWMASYNGLWHLSSASAPIRPIFQREDAAKSLDGHIVRDIDGTDSTIYFTKEARYSPPFAFSIGREEEVRKLIHPEAKDFQCNRHLSLIDTHLLFRSGCSFDMQGRLELYNLKDKSYEVFLYDYSPEAIDYHDRKIYIGSVDVNKEGESHLLTFNIDQKEYKEIDLPEIRNNFQFKHLDVVGNIIWIGSTDGLYCYNQEKAVLVNKLKEELLNSDVTYVQQYGDELFVGTDNQGLFVYDVNTEGVSHYSEAEGLLNKTIATAYPIDDETVLAATFNGLHILDRDHGVLQVLYTEDGLSHEEFNRFSYHVSSDSNLYLGTMNGVTFLDLHSLRNDFSANTMIKSVDVYYSQKDTTVSEIVLSNEKNDSYSVYEGFSTLTVNFNLTNSEYIDKAKFLVKIGGYDEHWRLIDENKLVLFSEIPHGDYTLDIIGIDNFGNKARPAHIDITIKQRWYNTIGFKLLLGLLGLLLLGIAVLNYIKDFKLRETQKTALNKKMSELELIAFRSQMNPHFIFNALGSIQYFIQTADTQSADDYLTKFGKLMRRFLEASKASYTSLSDELDLLKHYLDLEKLRGEGSFDYVIDVDDDIMESDVFIPSMILQPFIENAILHGIGPLRGRKGMIKLSVKPIGHRVQISIDDNGIGREAALARRARSHASRGLGIVNDRIASLNQQGDHEIVLNIVDKKDDQGIAEGTTVVLTLKDNINEDH